ncbi:hypothetical protein [Jeongeupia chitinilytica]|uniref:Thioredoxin family protein n=1 Tax=Jeongeupia chitinilytica TaxID=1041641 RepID=A0ABQ3H1S9_9NEIS|nr:hypothetical protein [Jeongeupia chitinilytica]GHD66064.1 hypothetical protein GCM10007350_27700 [Jeongeupia chitinilytica]
MAAILFHDGCNLCLSIAAAFESLDVTIDIVNLGLDNRRAAEAAALGVTRLPSLVVNGKVLKIEDHSPIEHVLAVTQ